MNIYERIKYLRMKKGLSQDELAEKVGYTHRSSIGKVENGLVDLPQSKIKAFADALDTTPQELMGWFNDEPSFESREEVLEDVIDFFDKHNYKIDCGTNNEDFLVIDSNGKIINLLQLSDLLIVYEKAKKNNELKAEDITKQRELFSTAYTIPVLGLVQAGVPITAVENIIEYEELDPKEYKRPEEYFGLKINGDSMEPKLFKDDTVIVHQQSSVENNDIAIVLVNGEDATCKKVTFNDQGIILVSLNPKYEPMFYSLEQIETLPVTIIGKVVELRRKF